MEHDALDFVVLVCLLGVVLFISINLTIPMFNKSLNANKYEVYDKTVGEAKSEIISSDYDGCMCKQEVVIAVMSQNFFMAQPRVISIAGNKINVYSEDGYSPYNKDIGGLVAGYIDTWFEEFKMRAETHKILDDTPKSSEELRYVIRFDMNDPDKACIHKYTECPHNGKESDDTYSLFVKFKRKDAPEYNKGELFKLLPGGKLEDCEGNII